MTDKEKYAKKIKKRGMVGLAICVIAIIVGIIINEGFLYGLGALFAIACVICMFDIGGIMTKDYFCSQCGSSRRLNECENIDYEMIGEKITDDKVVEKVEVYLTCPKCGYTDKRTKKITVQTMDKNGNIKNKNLEDEIRKMFK